MRKFSTSAVIASVALLLLVGCGSEPVAVPDVTGYRLDDAHNILKDAGFENFEDVDAIDDRQPLWDSNWVVLIQEPAARENAEKDVTVRLEIAKPDDEGVRARLPKGSPVSEELRAQDRADELSRIEQEKREEKLRKEQEAEDARAAQGFIDTVDPGARLAKNAITDLGNQASEIANSGNVTIMAEAAIKDIRRALEVYKGQFEHAPDHINNHADQLQESLDQFIQGARTLLSAEGASATGSIDRFWQLYNEGRSRYNDALTNLYAGTSVQPPLL